MRRSIFRLRQSSGRHGLLLAALFLVGCGSPSGSPIEPSGTNSLIAALGSTFNFSRSPIDPAVIEFITPLGNLNPPGHTLPTDHIYFYHHLNHRSAPQFDVAAPADGIVGAVMRGNDDAIYVWTSKTQMYYIGHVVLDAGFAQNQRVTAGQRLGVTSALSFGLDLGLVDYATTIPFLVPARYSDNSLHAEAPLKYFAEPLRSQV